MFGIDPFDLNGDGELDPSEYSLFEEVEDKYYYDSLKEKDDDEFLDEDEKELKEAGVDLDFFYLMSDVEKKEELERCGLDPDDYTDMFDNPDILNLDDNELELYEAGIDLDDFNAMDDFDKKEELELNGLDPNDFRDMFKDPDTIDMDDLEQQLYQAGIDIDSFKWMDDEEKLEELEDKNLDPEVFLEYFDTDDIDELRESIEDENDDEEDDNDDGNYDERKAEITDYGNPEYKEIIDNAGCYTDDILLYENILYQIAESYGVSLLETKRIAQQVDYTMFGILAAISKMTEEEKLATFTPVERIIHLTGADKEVSQRALDENNGDETATLESLKGNEFKKHISCKMMAAVTEATNVAYLETLRFLLKTNGDVDAAIKLIEDLPIGVRLAITPIEYRKDLK